MPAKQEELVWLKIEDAPASAGWAVLWQRLLAPPPPEAAQEAPTSAPVAIAPESALEEAEAR